VAEAVREAPPWRAQKKFRLPEGHGGDPKGGTEEGWESKKEDGVSCSLVILPSNMGEAFQVGGWDARGFIDGGTFSASKLGNVKTFQIRERSCLYATDKRRRTGHREVFHECFLCSATSLNPDGPDPSQKHHATASAPPLVIHESP
jgi:hypothetical protein